jgi:hydrogenase/urease accessory protein HupE
MTMSRSIQDSSSSSSAASTRAADTTRPARQIAVAAASLLASASALAHPGHDSTGLMASLAHALFGWHDVLSVLVMTALVAGAGIGLIRASRRAGKPVARADQPHQSADR